MEGGGQELKAWTDRELGYLDIEHIKYFGTAISCLSMALKVFVLTNLGKVYVWEENRESKDLILCLFNVSQEILMADIGKGENGLGSSRHEDSLNEDNLVFWSLFLNSVSALNRQNLLLVSKDGLAFEGIHSWRKVQLGNSNKVQKKVPSFALYRLP